MIKRILRYIFIKREDKKKELPLGQWGITALQLYHKENCVYLQILWLVIVSLVVALLNISSTGNTWIKLFLFYLVYILIISGLIVTKKLAKKLLNIREAIRWNG